MSRKRRRARPIAQLHNAAKIELFDADGKPLPAAAEVVPGKAAPGASTQAPADKPKTP